MSVCCNMFMKTYLSSVAEMMLHKVIGLDSGPAAHLRWQSLVLTLCIQTSHKQTCGMSHCLAVKRCNSVRLESAVSQTCRIYTDIRLWFWLIQRQLVQWFSSLRVYTKHQFLNHGMVSIRIYMIIWRPESFILHVDISWQMKPGLISWKEVKWVHKSSCNHVQEPFTIGHMSLLVMWP